MNDTLLFEEIPNSTSVINTADDTYAKYPLNPGHTNSPEAKKKVFMKKGRYGQTSGNILSGDFHSEVPICPYHMPRNTLRYEEPRLHIARKNARDIIEAKDINDLIDRIKLYGYMWEAEANNINNFALVNSRPNSSINDRNLEYANALDSNGVEINQPTFNIVKGSTQTRLYQQEQFYAISGTSETDVINKLLFAKNNQVETSNRYSSPLPFGFPPYFDKVVGGNNITNTITINAGHYKLVGVKIVNASDEWEPNTGFNNQLNNMDEYRLVYDNNISGDAIVGENNFVTDKDNAIMNFMFNVPYVVTHRTDNDANTKLSYYGFIGYHSKIYNISDSETTQSITELVSEPVANTATISGYGIPTETTPINFPIIAYRTTTMAIDFDMWNLFGAYINDPTKESVFEPVNNTIYQKSDLWYGINSQAFMKYFTQNTNHVLKIPEQKIENRRMYYKNPSGVWTELAKGIISIDGIAPYYNGDYTTPEYGFTVNFNVYDLVNDRSAEFQNSTFKTVKLIAYGEDTNTYENFTKEFLLNPIYYINNYLAGLNPTFQPIENGCFDMVHNAFIQYVPLVSGDDSAYIKDIYLDSNGTTYLELIGYPDNSSNDRPTYRYKYGQLCPDGSAPIAGMCTYYRTTVQTTPAATYTNGYTDIRENDYTFQKDKYLPNTNKYSYIKGTHYKKVRNVLWNYLKALQNMTISSNVNGIIDTTSKNELESFLLNHEAQQNIFDKDDPDTYLGGYFAQTTGLIKLDFYNNLVDAYKIIINSCLCNTDCACNLVCACNTNCGCNY